MMKRILMCVLSIFIIFLAVSCKSNEEEYNSNLIKYKVQLVCPEDETIDGKVVEVLGGEVYRLPKPQKEHYVFNGWLLDEELLDCTGIWSFENETLVADWSPLQYPINLLMYPFIGETVNSYTIENADIVLPTPSKVSGHMFLGWTGENISEPTKYIVIPSGSTGGKTYVGNWISVDEIENKKDNFVFEIVDDHAVVMGYCGDSESQLVIPSEYKGYPVTTIGNSAFYGLGKFTEMLNIPACITIIEDNAIGGCKGLPINILGADPQQWHENATIGMNNGGLTK